MSLVNGDGCRYVVFCQGCAHYCQYCQNPDTWDFNGGTEIDAEELAQQIKREFAKHPWLDGITLSGGDPFYQQEECARLLKLLPRVNVWIYTGFRYEEIANTELAQMADVIVDGEYVDELRCDGKMYGSSNQRIIRRDKKDRNICRKTSDAASLRE